MGLAQAHPNQHWSLHTQQNYLESTTSCEKMKIIIHLFLQKQMGWRMLASYDASSITHAGTVDQQIREIYGLEYWTTGITESASEIKSNRTIAQRLQSCMLHNPS